MDKYADCCYVEVPVTRKRIQHITNVVYAQADCMGAENVLLYMDILQPRQRGNMPAVLFIPGGHFVSANKDSFIQQRMALAEAGYFVASISYRTAPLVTFPAPLDDVMAAIYFIRSQAERFHVDVNRIGLMGESGGGYLAALAALTGKDRNHKTAKDGISFEVQAVVDFYGLSDLSCIGEGFSPEFQANCQSSGAVEALWINGLPQFGGLPGGVLASPERVRRASPVSYVGKAAPPFLFLHGEEDTMVAVSQSVHFHRALCRSGVQSECFILKGAGHGGACWAQPGVIAIVRDFFDRQLRNQCS